MLKKRRRSLLVTYDGMQLRSAFPSELRRKASESLLQPFGKPDILR